MAGNTIHLDVAVAFDTVGSLQLVHKDLLEKLHSIDNLNEFMQDAWEGGSARKIQGEFLDWLTNFGERIGEFENLMYRAMKEFEELQEVDGSGNFTPTHAYQYYDFSHDFTGSAEFLNQLKPLKPAPEKPNWLERNVLDPISDRFKTVGNWVADGTKFVTGMIWDGTKWVGKQAYAGAKTVGEYALKGGEVILKGGIAAGAATWGVTKAVGGEIKDFFSPPDQIPPGMVEVEVNGQPVYYEAGKAIPASGIPDNKLPEGYVKTANGDLAIPASKIPASAPPASARLAIPATPPARFLPRQKPSRPALSQPAVYQTTTCGWPMGNKPFPPVHWMTSM